MTTKKQSTTVCLAVMSLAVSATLGIAGSVQFADVDTWKVRKGGGGEFTLRVSEGALAGKDLAADLGYVPGVTMNVTEVGFSASANALAPAHDGSALWGADTFETFCIERNQNLGIGQVYTYEIGAGAVPGGIGGGQPDPNSTSTIDYLSKGTARLYSEFARVNSPAFSGGGIYDYSISSPWIRRKDAEELQWAFWYLEGESTFAQANGFNSGGTHSGSANKFLEYLAVGSFNGSGFNEAQLQAWKGHNTEHDPWRVAAINLGDHPTHGKQDQLVLWDVAFQVPDGGLTLLLLGLGLGCVGTVKRFSGKD